MAKPERSRAISLAEVRARIPGPNGERSLSLFRHGTLEIKLAAPVAPNVQSPHLQDEVYVILRGRGSLHHDGRRDPFEPGDLLFVAAGTEHHFEEFSDDLLVWVAFYGPSGGESTG